MPAPLSCPDSSAPQAFSSSERRLPDPMPQQIDVLELVELRERGPAHAVLDVREGWEREICALPQSLHIPMSEVPARLSELSQEGIVVVLCHHGM